jgi:hypothetical protein
MSLPKGHAAGHVRDAFRAMVEERRPRDPEPSASIDGESVFAGCYGIARTFCPARPALPSPFQGAQPTPKPHGRSGGNCRASLK